MVACYDIPRAVHHGMTIQRPTDLDGSEGSRDAKISRFAWSKRPQPVLKIASASTPTPSLFFCIATEEGISV